MKWTRHSVSAILAALVLCGALGRADAAEPSAETIARGKALVVAGDCAGCHTAEPAKPFAGGKRIETPFGDIYAPNLTPDRETGLGMWTEAHFYQAMRFGVAPDESRYYPAFPYPNFTVLVRDDISAIRAYLGTLDPVRSTTPPAEPRFPFNFRVVMRIWNWLYFKPGIIIPDQTKGVDWNRGRYLVEGLSHCSACHTSKNFLRADKRDQAFEGALKSWSVQELTDYLRSGRTAKGEAGKAMAEIVARSTSKMSDGDIRAIAVYLKSLPAGAQ